MRPKKIHPLFYEMNEMKKQYPQKTIADIARSIKERGIKNANGNLYTIQNLSHIYRDNLAKFRQEEMVRALEAVRGKSG